MTVSYSSSTATVTAKGSLLAVKSVVTVQRNSAAHACYSLLVTLLTRRSTANNRVQQVCEYRQRALLTLEERLTAVPVS
jgi:hypothetical protein